MSARAAGVLLGLAVLVPRVVRLVHPDLWDEDSFALASARLLANGAEPYRDFDAPYVPAVEAALALLFRFFGSSVRVAEGATQALQGTTALLLGLAARRAFGWGAGIVAAAIYGCSQLVFRYHVFEHETLGALALAAAFLVCSKGPPAAPRRTLALGVCLAAALLAKASLLPSVLGVLAWRLLATRDARSTIRLALGAVLPLVLVCGFLAFRYGSEFWLQSVGLHLVKGSTGGFVDRARSVQREVDLSLAAGICGGIAALRSPRGSLSSLALLVGILEWASAFFLKTTLWAHNLIPLLVPASVLGAAAASRAARGRPTRGGTALGALFLALGANAARHARLVAVPGREAFYGFGFFPRAELDRIVREIRAACPPAQAVEGFSPLFGFAAGRDPGIAFAEFHPVLDDLRDAIAKVGIARAIRERSGRRFWKTSEDLFPRYADALAARALRGEVGVLVFEPDQAVAIAGALRERGVPLRLDPEPSPGPPEPRVYRVVRGP
ncbi:MAG TPA: hypothetical protein VFI25_07000 [Planctomycetota bacterium]|nr:hypothetical protein [Planctomycetota bacterium]